MPTESPLIAPTNGSFNLEDLPLTVPVSKDFRSTNQSSTLDFYPDLAKGPGRQSWETLLPAADAVGFGQGLQPGDHLFQEDMLLGSSIKDCMQPPKQKALTSRSSHEALQASLHSIVEGSGSDKDLEQSSVQALNPGLTQQLSADPGDEIDRQREKNR